MKNGVRNGVNNGLSLFQGYSLGSVFESLGLGQDDFVGSCSTPGAIAGTLGGIFIGEKVADFASKQTKLPSWGPVAIKFGTAVALGMWASKKGIL